MEGKKAQSISSAYRVTIFEDENGNHIVTTLPTMIAKPEKAHYEAKQVENDSEIDAKTTEEITEFLEAFFKFYPSASEKELEYYIENDTLRPLDPNLKFMELVNPIYKKNGKGFQINVGIKYLNVVEKVTNIYQYQLRLIKNGNWRIIASY
ncbi:hypothetical protein EsVE80_14220 [Enterococcus saigonensis]|uniref:Conjugative transposon protein n=1 Tax=Enterococcus saigonensis TaxID=1805431 RepID=A0A679ICJ2_9ENTE|nr:hypothetical protein EsVE80_14220 [Enterococcus saigonensis]